jgi:ribosomal protein L34
MTHNTGKLRIVTAFNYRESLLQVRQQVQPEDEKGKERSGHLARHRAQSQQGKSIGRRRRMDGRN